MLLLHRTHMTHPRHSVFKIQLRRLALRKPGCPCLIRRNRRSICLCVVLAFVLNVLMVMRACAVYFAARHVSVRLSTGHLRRKVWMLHHWPHVLRRRVDGANCGGKL